MRYPASEKQEITHTVEGSHLPTKKTLDMSGIPRSAFYQWYDRDLEGRCDDPAYHSPRPKSVWNRIAQDRRHDLMSLRWSIKRGPHGSLRLNTLMRSGI